jgi:ABC-type transport system involved in cytochrome c biogenesis permease subunit
MTIKIVAINFLVMIIFMICASLICENGLMGGECVKHADNKMFLVLLMVNLIGGLIYIFKSNRKGWLTIFLSIFLTSVLYVIMATLHSISKAGLF